MAENPKQASDSFMRKCSPGKNHAPRLRIISGLLFLDFLICSAFRMRNALDKKQWFSGQQFFYDFDIEFRFVGVVTQFFQEQAVFVVAGFSLQAFDERFQLFISLFGGREELF